MSDNVYRFSVKNDSETLVDMNAVEEVVMLSKEAAELGRQLEAELAAQDADVVQDSLKKFIREQIEASINDGQTRHVQLMDEDALVDLIIEKGLEHVEVKCESHLGKDNWQLCKDLGVLYLNSDQPNFEAIKLVQLNGVVSAKAWAKVGGAVAVGSNFVDVLTGEKTVEQAAKDMAASVAQEVLIDYAKSQIIATAVTQPVVRSAIKKFGGDILMKAVGQTPLGANAISATSNVLLNSTGLVAGAIKGVGGTTAGLMSTAGFTGAAGAITGVIGTAAAVAAPIAAPVAVAYGAYKLLKKIF